MSNVLSEERKQQVIALGKLGWSLRRIEEATGVRRETASANPKTAGGGDAERRQNRPYRRPPTLGQTGVTSATYRSYFGQNTQ
jgi:hypothetical protein